jgi:lysine 2,3-aminomutase
VLAPRSDTRAGFSVCQALWELARSRERSDLAPGFYAELIHWVEGLEGRAAFDFAGAPYAADALTGRDAAVVRSGQLDQLWQFAAEGMARFDCGLSEESQARRAARKRHVLETLGGTEADWADWRWHLRNLVTEADALARLAPV